MRKSSSGPARGEPAGDLINNKSHERRLFWEA
jgi:hypothetical protein